MPHFTLRATAQAMIVEYWLVEADTEEEAREALDGHEGGRDDGVTFICQSVEGDETDRDVEDVMADGGKLANELAQSRRAEEAAGSMFDMLKEAEAFISGFEDDEEQEGIGGEGGLLERMRAAVRRVEEAA